LKKILKKKNLFFLKKRILMSGNSEERSCCRCLLKTPDLLTNEDMDENLYCVQCLDAYNLQRFSRKNYRPDEPVDIELRFVPEYDRKRKCYTAENSIPPDLPKLRQRKQEQQIPEGTKTITELAYEPWPDIVPDALQKKHPHEKDAYIRLDETNGKHLYYVRFSPDQKDDDTDFIQSTSRMVGQYFHQDFPSSHDLLYGECMADLCTRNKLACTDETRLRFDAKFNQFFTDERRESLERFEKEVLFPIINQNKEKFDTIVFVDKVLAGADWGPDHPKYAKFYATDENKLVSNLQDMLKSWKKKKLDAITRGKFVHFLIECDMNGQIDLRTHPVYGQPQLNHIQQYLKWKATKFDPYFEPYRTEMQFFDDGTYRRVGTCDLMAVAKNHPPPEITRGVLKIHLIDWKNTTMKKKGFFNTLKKRYEMGRYPMHMVHDCNFEHYQLQQADYDYMASKFYRNFTYKGHIYDRIEFVMRKLVCLDDENPDNDFVEEKLKENYRKELDIIWEKRAQEVKKWKENGCPKDKTHIGPKRKFSKDEKEFLLLHLIRKNIMLRQFILQERNLAPKTKNTATKHTHTHTPTHTPKTHNQKHNILALHTQQKTGKKKQFF